jgi:hypothetical protein
MYLLVSVPNEAFHKVMSLRAAQRRLGIETSVYRNSTDLLRGVERYFGGRLVLLDWEKCEIVASVPVPGASGLALLEGAIYASSWTDHSVHVIRPGKQRSCLSHPWFNHLHTAEPTEWGTLLIASAGIDLILELSPEGELKWHWFGPDHGYSLPDSKRAVLDSETDYRVIRRGTSERAMHVTSAFPMNERTILAALFRQGEIIAIDRVTGETTLVKSGLLRPHGIHRRPGGYIASDTLGHRILLFDEGLRLCSELPFGSQWLQDTIVTTAGSYVSLENVHIEQEPEPGLANRVVELDALGRVVRQLTVPPDYRLFTVREADPSLAQWLIDDWGGNGKLGGWVWN